jgi:hypothetical protein
MTYYLHIKAHQDNNKSFNKLSWKVQLNCIFNHTEKQQIAVNGTDGTIQGQMYPLKPSGVFVRGEKMTSETGAGICFWAQHQLA